VKEKPLVEGGVARTADVIIIGGGVIGCSIAYYLARSGTTRIVVLERGKVGSEASWASAGMLAPQAEGPGPGPFLDLCLKGKELFRPLSEELKERAGIDIEYLTWGVLSLIEEGGEEEAEARRAWQAKLGLRVERLSPKEVKGLEPGVKQGIAGALFFPDDHHVDNRELVRALSEACRSSGVTFLEGTPAVGFILDNEAVQGVTTPKGVILGKVVVLAAGCWSAELLAPLGRRLPVKPARGQIVYTELPNLPLRHVVWGREGYIVPRLNGGLLIGSTVEFVGFDKGVTLEGVRRLTAMAVDLVPGLSDRPFITAWAGLRPHSPDALPLIGPLPGIEGLLVATGHFRNGILLGPLTGKLMAELIVEGKPSFPLEAFSPARFDRS